MKKKYKHIFFDLDNTLWDFDRNAYHAMQITFQYFLKDCKTSFEDFFKCYSRHNHSLWEEYRNRTVTKKALIQKRFQLTFDDLNIQGINSEEMNHFYLEEMSKQTHLVESASEVLKYLKKKNYNLYIITNGFKEVQIKKLKNSGLDAFFKKVFISEVIKVPKPNREIFEYAIKSANAKKSESIMIGDDWYVDILGANKFGLDSIHYSSEDSVNNHPNTLNSNNKYEIHRINSLRMLYNLL